MQVQRIRNNYNNYNIYNQAGIYFQGGKQKLIAISKDSFRSEYTKNLYSKIQQYFQMLGESGNIKEAKLLDEKKHYCISQQPYVIDVDAAVCISINKGERNSNIKLYHKYPDPQKNDDLIFDITLDKNGQMIRGQFAPETLFFERDKGNIRRMRSDFRGNSYLPVGGNDREWSCLGKKNLSSTTLIDDSEKSAFEIFIELARLKTSII